jgi:hypothetical protein
VFAASATAHTVQRRTQEDLFAIAPEILRLLSETLPIASADATASLRLFSCLQMWLRYCRITAAVMSKYDGHLAH